VRDDDYLHTTLDLSHSAVAKADGLEMARDLGDRLAHIHLADGTGSMRDEHLVPGRGTQPVAEVVQLLARTGFTGDVIVEVSTRGRDRQTRERDLEESLAFARRHLALA
jgi:sugar phosphate isomerase/epimerase